ncbi:MAG: hypothetical protein J5J06_04860 [Phycisphaerae bacterium]|nr:hypothetical protein [Phycisphaerae bacterium]
MSAANRRRESSAPLTVSQAALVRENLGLVGLHLRRIAAAIPKRRRNDLEDLFQEGSFGLIRAARQYDPACGVGFAPYALARIHQAVHRAAICLRRQAMNGSEPICGFPDASGESLEPQSPLDRDDTHVRVGPLTAALRDQLAARPDRHEPLAEAETLGDRIYECYARAVRQSADRLIGAASSRPGRAALLDAIVEERLLIPDEESRCPLREIARMTDSSYGRVAQCERQILLAAESVLGNDPAFLALWSTARSSPDGVRTTIDEDVEALLGRRFARESGAIYDRLKEHERASFVHAILSHTGGEIPLLLEECLLKMVRGRREDVLRRALKCTESTPTPSPRRAATAEIYEEESTLDQRRGRSRRRRSRTTRHDPDAGNLPVIPPASRRGRRRSRKRTEDRNAPA